MDEQELRRQHNKKYYQDNKIHWKISYLLRKIDGKIVRKSPTQIKQEKMEKKLIKFREQLRNEGLID